MSTLVTTRLRELETVIERGLNTFVEVGQALLEIRDNRLYKESYSTFEEYCRERWGMERRHAYRLIDAAQVVENVSNWTQITPANESQTRPLVGLSPDEQKTVWLQAVETAPNGKVTGARNSHKPRNHHLFTLQRFARKPQDGRIFQNSTCGTFCPKNGARKASVESPSYTMLQVTDALKNEIRGLYARFRRITGATLPFPRK